jgi:hypothetical protein
VTVGRAAGSSAATSEEDEAVVSEDPIANDCRLALSTNMLAAASTISWNCHRKIHPNDRERR